MPSAPDIRRRPSAGGLAALLLAALVFAGRPAAAQERLATVVLRGVPLAEALERFVHLTGEALAYDPALVEGLRAFCATEAAETDALLRCILADSGLDFYRLSSGTYVLTARVELPPRPGFVTGVVVDGDTGGPVADAHVAVTGAGVGSVTNEAGYFSLPPLLPGRYALRITHVGYRPWGDTLRVAADTRTRAEATLTAEPIFIRPVVVDGLQQRLPSEQLGTAQAGPPGDPGAPPASGPGGLFRTFEGLPGVHLRDVTRDVHLQGGEAGEHQLRLDGVPVFLPRHLAGLVGPFSAFALDRLTVHKAGFGAPLGSHTAGVLSAEQAVGRGRSADVLVDPLSANARLQHSFGAGSARPVDVMAAARVSLWEAYRTGAVQSTLDAWGTPDPFLATAAVPDTAAGRLYRAVANVPGLRTAPRTGLGFTDLHGAARMRVGAVSTLQTSIYYGRQHLGGSLLPSRSTTSEDFAERTALTVEDDYAWRNLLGQVRFSSIRGARTLVGVRAYASRYTLDHAYTLLDSLGRLGTAADADYRALLQPVRDANAVGTAGASGTVDYVRGHHQLVVGAEVALTRSRFDLHQVHLARGFEASAGGDVSHEGPEYLGSPAAVRHTAHQVRAAGYMHDEISLGRRHRLEAGVRLTYLPARQTVYAEPRLAFRTDREAGPFGPWSARTATGLYRQFVNQLDLSVLNVGAVLPSVRIWLPVDASVRPPIAYHVAQELVATPRPGWTLHAEAYARYRPHAYVIRYAQAGEARLEGRVDAQSLLLAPVKGSAYGASLRTAWRGTRGRAEVLYEYGRATWRSAARFAGTTQPVPWSEPHRVAVSAAWHATPSLWADARWSGVWGRTWGFRQAYYDFYGHAAATRYHGPYDLGDPGAHALPPLRRLDVGATYTQPVGSGRVALRVEVLNVFDRANVADWRLARTEQGLRKAPRLLYPRTFSAALRIHF